MAFASFMAQLKLNIQDFSKNLDKASRQMAKFAASSASGTSKTTKSFKQYGETISKATTELNKHKLSLKDTARIVQGILVSQAFYGVAGSIRDATTALWEFNESLDYANVTYSALFGSQELGTGFLATLREYAEDTIFSYEQLADSSKKLLAYNIPYKNLMFIMEGLTNLGAMSGDAAALDRIALALGQIYTKGKLSAEEMRQLANAYVPIYDIVQSKFGLSGDDMKRVGDLNLPAADVINAIIDYANEKFGGVGDAAMMTITGLKQKITDSIKNLGVDILKPVTVIYKSLLKEIATRTAEIRDAYKAGGLGGIFEYLVPDKDMQTRIRQFFANVQALFKTLMQFMHSVGQVFKAVITGFMDVFNVMAPVLNYTANILVGMLQIITSNSTALRMLAATLAICAGAWVLFRVQALATTAITALAKVLYGVATAVLFLSKALASSPIVTALLLITVGLAGVATASKKADGAISNLFNKLTGLNKGGGGAGRDGVLQLNQQLSDAAAMGDRFNDRMSSVTDSVNDVGDAADSAGKKANKAKKEMAGLLSFDEVFKLNEPTEETDMAGTNLGGLGGFNLDDTLAGLDALGAGIEDALIPEIPDFSDFADGFVGDLKDSLLAKLGLAGLGALLTNNILKQIRSMISKGAFGKVAGAIAAGLAKALMGAFIGYGFDAIASLLTDKLWAALEGALKLKEGSAEQASFGATLGSILGGAIGMLVGGLPGSLVGAAIGHLAGGVVGLFWQTIDGAFNNTAVGFGTGILTAIARAFGGSIKDLPGLLSASTFSGFFKNVADLFTATGLKSLAKGGIIGAAIGFVVDTLAALLWDKLADSLSLSAEATGNAKVGQTIGSILGTVIGGIFGGPAGAIIGSAIGTFAGGFVGLFWEKIVEAFQPVTDAVATIASSISETFSGWWTMTRDGLKQWFGDTKEGFTTWFNETTTGLNNWWTRTTEGFSTWWSDTKESLSSWWSDTVAIFSDWDNITGDTLANWWRDTTSGFDAWWTDTKDRFSTWWKDTTGGFATWSKETIVGISAWALDTKQRYEAWKTDTTKVFTDWALGVVVKVSAWALDTKKAIDEWVTTTKNNISDWASTTWKSISTWAADVVKAYNEFKTKALEVIGGFVLAAAKAIGKWRTDTYNSISKWFNGLITDVQKWWQGLWDPSKWLSGWSLIKGWFSDLFSGIRNWFTSLGTSVSSWWNGLWSNKRASVSLGSSAFSLGGHATGGIFTKEHIARFAEGNKAEAVIPLENASAMQPFVDAISRGILEGLAPTLSQSRGGGSDLPPIYVGTLIGDERGLKELYKKFQVIKVQEDARRGVAMA